MSPMNRAAPASIVKLHGYLITYNNSSSKVVSSCLRTVLTKRMISTSDSDGKQQQNGFSKNVPTTINSDYTKAIHDLNLLQSNTQAIALAKYKEPKQILPLFEKQLNLAGIRVEDLDKLNIIHISGTKGKGSTCAFLESILRGEGLKTGFYNSPHLIKVTERIKLNGKQIDEEKFSKHFRYIYDRLQRASKKENVSLPSYFSFLTILAYHIFLEERVDCAIIEVGIGGQYDPTNIVRRPIACGITSIHFDHMNILGDSIESIAHSKAGIAKTGVPIFTVKQEHKSALDVIRRRASKENCPLMICKPIREAIKLGIRGAAQYGNASLACQLGHYFVSRSSQKAKPIHENELDTNLDELPPSFGGALASCSWPGRCQTRKYPRIAFYLDGAHTKESMENCLDWFLSETCDSDMRILMVNIIGDRNKLEILKPLAKENHFGVVIFSTNRINASGDTPKSETFVNMQTPNSDKSIENAVTNAKIWASLMKGRGCSDAEVKSNIAESLQDVIQRLNTSPRIDLKILVTGSLHFVGAVLETLPRFDKVLETL